jgi:excisionase family DNA binding protein
MNDGNDPLGSIEKIAPRAFGDAYLIDKKELSRRLGCSPRLVDDLVRRRKIPCIKLGYRTVRFHWLRVQEALAKFEVKEVGRK